MERKNFYAYLNGGQLNKLNRLKKARHKVIREMGNTKEENKGLDYLEKSVLINLLTNEINKLVYPEVYSRMESKLDDIKEGCYE